MIDLPEQLLPLQSVEHHELTRAFREVFALSSGKRVLFWMLEQCAIYEDAFSGDMTNATNYRLGLQAAGRRLIGQLDSVDPHMYPRLLLAMAEIREIDKAAAFSAAKQEGEEHDVSA